MMARQRLCLTLCILILGAGVVRAQGDGDQYLIHQNAANLAYDAQDYTRFLDHVLLALALKPNNIQMQYNAACGYSLTGAPEKAVPLLRSLAMCGVDYGAEEDADLASVRALPAYAEVRRLLREKLTPVHTSKELYRIRQCDLAAEGITYDPLTKRTFVSGMRHGTITVIDSLGNAYGFARLQGDVPYACIGIKVDNHRNLLWIAAASFAVVWRATAADHGAAAIIALDLATGDPVRNHPLPESEEPVRFNDLAVSSDGDVYVTGAGLYAMKSGETVPHLMDLPTQFIRTNGIAITPDDRHLFVVARYDGIALIDLATHTWSWVEGPADVPLTGIDGLAYHEHALFAIQNGVLPWRAVRLDLSDDHTRVLNAEILELGNPDLPVATTCVVVDDALYYVGHGPAAETTPVPVTALQRRWLGETIVMKAPLWPGGR